jgi:hypothetical protein
MDYFKSFLGDGTYNPNKDRMQWQNCAVIKREFNPDGSPKPRKINLPMGKDYSVSPSHIYILLETSFN